MNFTSLKTLNCTSNYLTGVDLSKNTALEQLDIGYYEEKIIDWYETNKIATLDLSKNTKLRWVSCEDLNMSSLNVSNCTALEYLSCRYNQLTSLNVSNCKALSGLGCDNNKLTSLDVTKNTALTSFNCGNNKISNLDLSKNTQLSTLYCENNQISQIDVSKMTKLSMLNCSRNKLKDLNIRNNRLLTLYCQKNQITTLVIGNNPNLLKAYNRGGTNVDGVMQYSYWQMYPVLDMGTLYVDAFVTVLENEVLPTGITLNKTSINMLVGEESQLSATITPDNTTYNTATWTSSDATIASVNNGVVKAKKAGKATITAKTVNGLTAICQIAITIDNNPSNPFADVKAEGWQYSAARYVYDNGYMTGKGEIIPGKVLFDPNAPINRSQFVQTLYNVEGKPSVKYEQKFSDVSEGAWYAKPVTWAEKNGIVAGNADGTFGVNGAATREQLAQMFYKYAVYKGYDTKIKSGTGKSVSDFPDADSVSGWAVNSLNWALSRGIMSGKGSGKLDPKGKATRVECATMLRNFMNAYSGELPKLASCPELLDEDLLTDELLEEESILPEDVIEKDIQEEKITSEEKEIKEEKEIQEEKAIQEEEEIKDSNTEAEIQNYDDDTEKEDEEATEEDSEVMNEAEDSSET